MKDSDEPSDKHEVALLLQLEGAFTDGARKLAFYRPFPHRIPNSNFATRLSPTFSGLFHFPVAMFVKTQSLTKFSLASLFALMVVSAILICSLMSDRMPLRLRKLTKELNQTARRLDRREIANMCVDNGMLFHQIDVPNQTLYYVYKERDCSYLLWLSFDGSIDKGQNPNIADATMTRMQNSLFFRRSTRMVWSLD